MYLYDMKQSAGILLYKIQKKELTVLLVHPGGPFFAKKDAGAWSIPKGEFENDEDPLLAAKREFFEETGQKIMGDFIPLKSIKQKSGKVVVAWAVAGELDVSNSVSNTFEIEWPPRSGKKKSFPEIDKAEWFSIETALEKIIPAQQEFIKELVTLLLKENKITI